MKIKLNKIIVIFSFVFAFSFITVDIGVIQHNNNKNASYIYMGIEKVSAGGIVEEVVGGFVDAVSNALGNVLNVVSGITQGTLSLITGGSFSDGYTQGFCSFDHYVESGSFLNPGDCEAAGGTVITKDKVLGGFCPANYPYTYEPSSYDINTCFKPCDAGTFSATAIAVYPNNCTPCPIGQYQSSAGQTSCVQCSEGSYQSLTGQTSCNPCPGGQYQSSVAQTSCVQCPSTYPYTKRIGATAQSQCYKICEAGTYNIGGRAFYQNNCIDCPIGKYQSLTGQTSCKYCPIGI
ncbi:MAG: hypothetical protein QM532_04275, partial [Cyanobium sp. MAG06]|nr:hypothetical protein [Cyanobium sp. MAG06]